MNKKTYLNREERNTTHIILALYDILPQAEKLAQDPTTLKDIRSAVSFARRARDGILARLAPDQRRSVQDEASKLVISAMTKSEVLAKRREIEGMNSTYVVKNADFLDLAEHCLDGACRKCTGVKGGSKLDPEAPSACRIRELFLKYEIEPINFGEGCPYQYE